MSNHQQSNTDVASEAFGHGETEIDDAQLEGVHGGAGFLSGALTTQEAALPFVDTRAENGFIMKESVIVRTSGR